MSGDRIIAITYNTYSNCTYIYRATSGGTVFSANLAGTTFDYFTDTAVVNDAIYFSSNITYSGVSDLTLNVGTALSGTGITITWEYRASSGWLPIYNLTDNTNGFTVTGANTVQFPLQPDHIIGTINSQANRCWVRARISAITSITEGGANSTTAPTIGNGLINLSGYDDTTPCTFTEIDTWINANRPDIESTKSGTIFKINNAGLNVPSGCTLRSTNEQIFIGNGTYKGIVLSGCHFGTLVGTDGWKDQVSIYSCFKSPGQRLTIGTPNTFKMYGGIMGAFTNTVNGITCTASGYLGMGAGTWIGVYQEYSGYFGAATSNRCTVDGDLVLSSTVNKFPSNLQIANPGSKLFAFYSRTQSYSGVTWSAPTLSIHSYNQMGAAANADITYTDFNPQLPLQTDSAPRTVSRTLGTAGNIVKFFYYDDSAGTFTDYTTEANSATVDDVPLSGDVGDIFYICGSTTNSTVTQQAYVITLTEQTNDYAYKLEYYGATNAWVEVPFTPQYDGTSNLTKSGTIHVRSNGSSSANTPKSVTINGQAGLYARLTITTKGTVSPTLSRVQYRSQTGITSGITYEKYTYNLNVKDASTNDVVENACVRITDLLDAEVYCGQTDSSGDIDEITLTRKEVVFDAQSSDADYNMKDVFKTPHSIKIRKYGYSESTFSKIASKSNDGTKISPNIYIDVDEATASAYTGIDIDHTTNTITIDEDHTMQEVYDYSQYDAQEYIADTQAYITSDGQTYFSDYDLVLDGCILSGSATISMVVNSVTYLNGATSTVTIVAVDGTHTNIKLTGLTANSRVQLYDTNATTELYNAVVAGTTLTYPIIWTADKPIRIRVMYVDGATAKQWYETTATLTNTGINLSVSQEDDTVYNTNAIDGSTVTECSISGSVLRVNIDDPDNATTAQRIYAFQVYWLFTEDGIADQDLYIQAIDSTHYTFYGGMKIKNMDLTNPLNITGGNLEPNTGAATDILDTTGGMILINPETVVYAPYSTVTNSYTNNIVGIEV